MLGKRRREIVELQHKGTAYDVLLGKLRGAEVRVLLNNMPLLIMDLEQLLLLLEYNQGEVEIVETHGSAVVDARVIMKGIQHGTMEEATSKAKGTP